MNDTGIKITADIFPFWSNLTSEEKQLVESRVSIQTYAQGQLARGGNMDCIGMFHVLKGVLRAYLLSWEGREVTLYRLRKGEVCVLSASCVLDTISFETQVRADEDCELLLLPIDVFSSLMKRNIHVERDVYRLMTERFSDVVAGVERLVFLNIEQRLASFLLDEASGSGSNTINMTHEQIAVNIGSAREVVSRTLKNLAAKNMVELFRGGVTLVDKPALYQLML